MRDYEDQLENDLKVIPEYCQSGARKYILYGQPNGGFLTSVFENDLQRAATKADPVNILHLADYARLMYNAPHDCWGSKEKVKAWIQSGGILGREGR